MWRCILCGRVFDVEVCAMWRCVLCPNSTHLHIAHPPHSTDLSQYLQCSVCAELCGGVLCGNLLFWRCVLSIWKCVLFGVLCCVEVCVVDVWAVWVCIVRVRTELNHSINGS